MMTKDEQIEAVAHNLHKFFTHSGQTIREAGFVDAVKFLLLHDLIHLGPRIPSEADALWEALDLEDNTHVTDAVIVAKIANFDTGDTALSMAATDGVDWVCQFGILHGAVAIMNQQHFRRAEDS